MARIDDYQQARDLAAAALSAEPLPEIARRSGFSLVDAHALRIPFLTRTYRVSYPAFIFSDETDPATQVPLQEQVLLLHYLQGSRPRLNGRWVAYREIKGASFYFGAFVKRAIDPLKNAFGQNIAGLHRAAAQIGAQALADNAAGWQIDLLPYAPLQIIVWEGDEEFSAEANILFDAAVGDYLSPEDLAWLASMTVYRLMDLARPA